MTRSIPDLALDFIERAEALRLTAYQDSRGVWTIGYGHTGSTVVEGRTITIVQAIEFLHQDLSLALARLLDAAGEAALGPLTDHQFGALVSFVFNLGADPKWNIWKLLRRGQLESVPAEMMRFTHARIGGKLVVVKGLANRRMAEVALWAEADVGEALGHLAAAPPSSETRELETPPVPAGTAKPLVQSKTFVTTAAAAVVTGAAAVDQVQSGVAAVRTAIQPYVADVPLLAHFMQNLSLAAAILAVAAAGFAWLKNHQARTQ